MDAEKQDDRLAVFHNDVLQEFSWHGVRAEVSQRKSGGKRLLIDDANGCVRAGQLMAVMGPSGSGKTTLLTAFARRQMANVQTLGEITCNGQMPSDSIFRRTAAFVEQEDTLIGSLTVRETLSFAGKLALPPSVSKAERESRVDGLLRAFGLERHADILVGTPIRKGISGGQKRRLSVAMQMITAPKIIFLDEPTSGLDSVASFEIVSYLKQLAKATNMIIIASIHQPSTAVFNLFDKLILMSDGRTAYNGDLTDIQQHFKQIGFPLPPYANPAESLLDLVNTDFSGEDAEAEARLDRIVSGASQDKNGSSSSKDHKPLVVEKRSARNLFRLPMTLIHRNFIKSYRDVLTYGIRIAMYLGLAILMGTVWLRLKPVQDSIQSFINAIFFGGAFMSFMAVAYIPAYLEDRAVFVKERANGLYGTTTFMIANFVIGLPYLFIICILFSVVAYWLTGFRDNAQAFFIWIMWLYLDLLAAESLVIFISSVIPIFVAALAITAFANGLWMAVGGFLVPIHILNAFYKYVFHYIDYQAYVFQGMMVNEFAKRTYSCASTPDGCQCSYPSALASQCKIPGTAVLASYGYSDHLGEDVGIMIAIIAVYRGLAWLALYLRKT